MIVCQIRKIRAITAVVEATKAKAVREARAAALIRAFAAEIWEAMKKTKVMAAAEIKVATIRAITSKIAVAVPAKAPASATQKTARTITQAAAAEMTAARTTADATPTAAEATVAADANSFLKEYFFKKADQLICLFFFPAPMFASRDHEEAH